MSIYIAPGYLNEIKNQGGGTLKRTTFHNSETGDWRQEWAPINLPTDGYFVGVYNIAVIDSRYSPDALDTELPMFFIPGGFTKYPERYYLGLWLDETLDWYVDISMHYQDLSGALAEAEAIGEKAIWDIRNKQEIRL